MSLYSKIFYADQLEHCPRPQHHRLQHFFRARGLSCPLILHHIVGSERRDAGEASIYNPEEVRIVQQYIVDLFGDSSADLTPRDVGIITPYAKQVRALEKQLHSLGSGFAGIECGTVEKFQGQERLVIVISTVRCAKPKDAPSEGSAQTPIGFLADPRRLNVAVSRAVAGLIIVGDLQTLAKHSAQWRSLVDIGRELGAIRGDPMEKPGNATAVQGRMSTSPETTTSSVPVAESSAAWDALTGN